jgi:hypothetical protein
VAVSADADRFLRAAGRFLYARCVPKSQEYQIPWQNPDVFGDKMSEHMCSLKIHGKAYKEQQALAATSNNQQHSATIRDSLNKLLCEPFEDFGRVRVT